MELIIEADKVVRTFLPVVLEAAGRVECARELRDSDPLYCPMRGDSDPKSVIKVAIILNEMSQIENEDASWQEIVENALFWCEAAVWAASRRDVRAFKDHVDRANCAMKEGLGILRERKTLH